MATTKSYAATSLGNLVTTKSFEATLGNLTTTKSFEYVTTTSSASIVSGSTSTPLATRPPTAPVVDKYRVRYVATPAAKSERRSSTPSRTPIAKSTPAEENPVDTYRVRCVTEPAISSGRPSTPSRIRYIAAPAINSELPTTISTQLPAPLLSVTPPVQLPSQQELMYSADGDVYLRQKEYKFEFIATPPATEPARSATPAAPVTPASAAQAPVVTASAAPPISVSTTTATPQTSQASSAQDSASELLYSMEDGKFYRRYKEKLLQLQEVKDETSTHSAKASPSLDLCPHYFPSGWEKSASAASSSRITGTSNGLRVEALQMSSSAFDLTSSFTRSQIMMHLGWSPNASVQEMECPGGRNLGMWLLGDMGQKLVLKLLSSKRKYAHIPTDAEKCMALACKCPEIGSDHSLSFPLLIFKCCEPSGGDLYDLLVMREAPGMRLTNVIAYYYRTNQAQLGNLVEIFRQFGKFLADFHALYQMQHGDCHPSNVFYDEGAQLFTMADVADIDTNPYATDDDDVTYFVKALMTLTEYYGSELLTNCKVNMIAGYKEAASVSTKLASHVRASVDVNSIHEHAVLNGYVAPLPPFADMNYATTPPPASSSVGSTVFVSVPAEVPVSAVSIPSPAPATDMSYAKVPPQATTSVGSTVFVSVPAEAPAEHIDESKLGSSIGLRIEALQMSSRTFDPTLTGVRSQILKYAECSLNASIEEMENPGGRNKGLWLLSDMDKMFVLKLISSARKYPHIPTDSEKCASLACKCPNIGTDPSVSFPVMVLKCCEPDGSEVYDLHVMKQAPGLVMAAVIAHYYRRAELNVDHLVEIFRRFGAFLAGFHAGYQMQHGDCHPSNVFYDEDSNRFTMIDVADIDACPYATDDDDVTYFVRALMTLTEYYGRDLLKQCAVSLRTGYKEVRDGSSENCATAASSQMTSVQQGISVGTLHSAPQPSLSEPTLASGVEERVSQARENLKGVRVEAVQMSSSSFDGTLAETASQVLSHMSCSPEASIREMANQGGLNKGTWLLTDNHHIFVMKLIDSKRRYEHMPTDTEKCAALACKCPDIGKDKSVSFPQLILKCYAPDSAELYDLHVMREAPGLCLSAVIAYHYRSSEGSVGELADIFWRFGGFLVDFHTTYQMQHGDCHPSNIFYDASSDQFTIIDIADISADPYNGEEDDVTYFIRALMTLEVYYGAELMTKCGASLLEGYKAANRMT